MTKCVVSLATCSRQQIGLFFLLLAAAVFLTYPAAANPEQWRAMGWTKTDFSKISVPFSEFLSGGPPKDGIPAIDRPVFKPVGKISDLGRFDPVITLKINGDARAYPLRVLMWHEIVNDVVGGVPVAVTYCPLCNTALVFKRSHKGRMLDFGTTGMLRHSDLVMYDRQTESWWQQFSGKAIVGSMIGEVLEGVPARLESFERFKKAHGQGKVLVPENPRLRSYGRNPYAGYDSRGEPYPLFKGDFPKGVNPMARVVAVEAGGQPFAVTLKLLREKRRIEKGDIIFTWQEGQASALDVSQIAKGRDVGNVIVQRKTPDGITDIVYHLTFAFAFHAFHPDIAIRTH